MQFSPDQCLHVAWPKCKHIRSSRRLKPEVPAPTRNTFFTFFHNACSKCFFSLFFTMHFQMLTKIQKHVKHMWEKNMLNMHCEKCEKCMLKVRLEKTVKKYILKMWKTVKIMWKKCIWESLGGRHRGNLFFSRFVVLFGGPVPQKVWGRLPGLFGDGVTDIWIGLKIGYRQNKN